MYGIAKVIICASLFAPAAAGGAAVVRVDLIDAATGAIVASTDAGSDGSFKFERVAGGRYYVRLADESPAQLAENHNSSRSNVATRLKTGSTLIVDAPSGARLDDPTESGVPVALQRSGGTITGRVAVKEEGLEAK